MSFIPGVTVFFFSFQVYFCLLNTLSIKSTTITSRGFYPYLFVNSLVCLML